MFVSSRPMRILDFDLENRPLSYWIPDRPTSEITAIACAWADIPRPKVKVWLLGRDDPREMLEEFLEWYSVADMVTGHYIRRHDLPILNDALIEYGLPVLAPKLTQDTKLDLVAKKDMPATQEHLSQLMGVGRPKVHMTQADWREANRLTPTGLTKTEARVAGDVQQHMELRLKLREAGLLKAPRVWTP